MTEKDQQILASLPPLEEEREARFVVRLATAQLCVECDAIYEHHVGGCPSCGSHSGFALTRVLQAKGTPTPWRPTSQGE